MSALPSPQNMRPDKMAATYSHAPPCGRAALNLPPRASMFPTKLFSTTLPHGEAPGAKQDRGEWRGPSDRRSHGQQWGCAHAGMLCSTRVSSACTPQMVCGTGVLGACYKSSDCSAILAGQPVTKTQLHATPETVPPTTGAACTSHHHRNTKTSFS
ncbi:unnamed protein product [Coccothraustes coccothraustes]